MLGSLLSWFAFLALLLEVFTFTLSVTDVSLESESLDCDSFLSVSEDHGSGIGHYFCVCE